MRNGIPNKKVLNSLVVVPNPVFLGFAGKGYFTHTPSLSHLICKNIHPVQDTPPQPGPDQTSSPHNVTFTTGLITLILVSFGAGITITIKVTGQLGYSTAAISRVYSLLSTTFISVYWVMANQELREFISRVFFRVVQSRFPSN